VKHLEGHFTLKQHGNANIYYQSWLPDDKAKAALLIVHGLAEHSGRYGNLVNHLVPAGYAAYGLDHYGHGKSDGDRVYVDRFSAFIDGLECYETMVRAWQPDLPIFLVGHSMGGLIGAYYLLDHQAGLAGAVLSGPAVKIPSNISGATILAGKILSTLAPKARLLPLEVAAISRDQEVVKAYVSDPLVYTGKMTARLSVEMLKAMQRVTAEARKITLPIFILNGGADRLVEPDAARMLYAGVSSQDKKLTIYEGFFHEVYNEPEREQPLNDVETWLNSHLA